MISFHKSNAKLDALEKKTGKTVWTSSLLSGWSCPFANECLSKVRIVNGKKKIEDGPNTKYRCFSASQEVLFPAVYNDRKKNLDTIRQLSESELTRLLVDSIPAKNQSDIIRINVGGDILNQSWFNAWMNTASLFPHKIFYAYTKSLIYWIRQRRTVDKLDNFRLTASYGGKLDHMIKSEGLRFAKVVKSVYEAKKLKLPIDHDDSHACLNKDRSFALLIHGVQPAGSIYGKAVRKLKGKGSYKR